MGDVEDRIISEEYKIWKKNTPFMYDFMMTRAVEWPSPTVQWLPDVETLDGNNVPLNLNSQPKDGDEADGNHPGPDHLLQQRIILGTHTTSDEPNSLIVASVILPGYVDAPTQNDLYHMRPDEFGSFSYYTDKFDLQVKVTHDGQVRCARYMPHNANIIASKSDQDLFVYDIDDCLSDQLNQENCEPMLKFADLDSVADLAWNGLTEGSLLTGYKQESVALWDINQNTDKKGCMKPKLKLTTTSNSSSPMHIIRNVNWHRLHPSIVGATSDQGYYFLWDIRSSDSDRRPSHQVHGHTAPVNCIDFNPFSETVFLTASSDGTIAMWDIRNLKIKLHSLQNTNANGSNDEFNRVSWSPHNQSLLAASNNDRRISLFDLDRIFEEQRPDETDDGPSTLTFVHNGHTSRVYDFDWNPNDPLMICSVSDDNVVQVWQIMSQFFNGKK